LAPGTRSRLSRTRSEAWRQTRLGGGTRRSCTESAETTRIQAWNQSMMTGARTIACCPSRHTASKSVAAVQTHKSNPTRSISPARSPPSGFLIRDEPRPIIRWWTTSARTSGSTAGRQDRFDPRWSHPLPGPVSKQAPLSASRGNSDRMPRQHRPSVLESRLLRGARAANPREGRAPQHPRVPASPR
jgi:hypothetical protein